MLIDGKSQRERHIRVKMENIIFIVAILVVGVVLIEVAFNRRLRKTTKGALLLFLGFALLFVPIFSGGSTSSGRMSIYQSHALCNNSFIEGWAMIVAPNEFLKSCSMVDLFFFGGILLGIIGLVLLTVGLIKKKE